eukprot:10192084-Karenia_brevis.AAC.1
MTVKQEIGELMPQLQRPQYESSRGETVDDERSILEEWKSILEIPHHSGCVSSSRRWPLAKLIVALRRK